MQRVELEVKPRDLGDKKQKLNLNQLRSKGWIPAVLYGQGDPVKVAVDEKYFLSAVKSKAGLNALFNIKLGGQTALGVVKEVQRHILTHKVIHLDLNRISLKDKLDVSVPVHIAGEAPGVKNSGGILENITREIRVRCLPEDIPAAIDIDVSHPELGHGIKVKDIPPMKGVEFMTAAETIVVNIVAPKIEEEKPAAGAEAAAAGAAEPEVIAKGKKEEEGAAAAKGKEEKKK